MLLVKAWYFLTSINCLAAIIIFLPVTSALATGMHQAIFILIFITILLYNLYALWIVNVLLKEKRSVVTKDGTDDAEIGEGCNNEGYNNSDPEHFQTPVEKF